MKIERVLTVTYGQFGSFIPIILVGADDANFRIVLVQSRSRSFLGILITLPWQASIVRKLQELAAR
ncbi:MAG TPA: hypothetical protein VMV04_18325 [Thermodesulfobacteriota bacterium]|nr:hypothetical protein [Thermodesulfobacteriota bacterium]